MNDHPGLRATLKADLLRYSKRANGRSFARSYILFPGLRVTFWFRLTQYIKQHAGLRWLSPLFVWCLLVQQRRTGIELNPGTSIGAGIYMPHGGGIVINPNSVIGPSCYISHGVTLGKAHTGPHQGSPSLGCGVFIGPGAVILGKLHIGDNAAIGANSVVLNDIPANTFAAGSPAKVIKETGASEILGLNPFSSSRR
jgi:serine O-acetyltransferase